MKQVLSVILLGCLCLTQAFAGEQNIITAKVKGEQGRLLKLNLILDKNSDITKFKITDYMHGKVTLQSEYKTHKAAQGIVILEMKGREIIKLISHNFSSHQGGNVTLDFLYNGATGSRGKVEFDLSRNGDKWLVTVNGKRVNQMIYIKNRKRIIGDVGIKRIEFN